MKFLDKFQKLGSSFKGPGTDFEDETYDGDEDESEYEPEEEYEEPKDIKKETGSRASVETMKSNNVRPKAGTTLPGVNIAIRRPTEFAAVGDIASDVLEGQTVAINLEHTTRETAIRIFDFLSGVAFSVEAKIEPVADNTYIIVPSSATITTQELKEESKASNEDVIED